MSSVLAYQSFMAAYVRRINEATLNVTIGGVRIGTAKHTRLAQINLHSGIITFSRYAIENVPERGRRYLVIHELSHVKEPSHNKNFWRIVERYEPDYKKVSRLIQEAFSKNVKSDLMQQRRAQKGTAAVSTWDQRRLIVSNNEAAVTNHSKEKPLIVLPESEILTPSGEFFCEENEFGDWSKEENGIMSGGSEDWWNEA